MVDAHEGVTAEGVTPERFGGAVQRGDTVFVHPYGETTAGVHLVIEPVLAAPFADVAALDAHVRAVLLASTAGLPHPSREEWRDVVDPVPRAMGERSATAAYREAIAVSFRFDGASLLLVPSRNGGRREGFVWLPELESSVPGTLEPAAGEHRWGAALQEALRASE